MSLLLSPLFLVLVGVLIARVSKSRRVWRRHSLFAFRAAAVVLVVYTLLMLGLFVDHAALAWLSHILPGETGTDWVVNSGILHWDATWPIASTGAMLWTLIGFMLFPLWMYIGVLAGYWFFGRNPRQRGIVGLLQ
jgi:hypothetical protein